MTSFQEFSQQFEDKFNVRHFPDAPSSLYDPAQYILSLGGKRIRPVMCLMGNELVNNINPDTWHVATAIELFHNFTLIHDDIMDKAPLRRGMETVHHKYGESTALLAGDVMLVVAYDYVNKINKDCLQKVMRLFNRTAKEVCEGQQLDMDFEKRDPYGEKKETVSFDEYVTMIELKTSVALAASLQLGAILGGAGEGNQKHLYEFGKNLGIAFQVQDDYLDAFGDPDKFGKKVGGDIIANKKTFLLIHAMEAASAAQLSELEGLSKTEDTDKIKKVLQIYKDTKADAWANELKEKYFEKAMHHLEEIAILSARKKPLQDLAAYLINREK